MILISSAVKKTLLALLEEELSKDDFEFIDNRSNNFLLLKYIHDSCYFRVETNDQDTYIYTWLRINNTIPIKEIGHYANLLKRYKSWLDEIFHEQENKALLYEKLRQYSNPLIEKISPEFLSIYNQCNKAEKYDLKDIIGMGYRKSLEFLVKDYLIHNNQDKFIVAGLSLNKAINMIESAEIKKAADALRILGNDFTHYNSIETDLDISDLKKLILLVIRAIELEDARNSIAIETDEIKNKLKNIY